MTELLEIVVPWALSLALLFAFLRWDEGRLTPEEARRVWPPASRSIALVYFGVLAIPVHFGRTRRTIRGVLEGLAWGAAIAALDEGAGVGVEIIMKRLAP